MADDREYTLAKPRLAEPEGRKVLGLDGKPIDSPLSRGGRKLVRVTAVVSRVSSEWSSLELSVTLDKNHQGPAYSLGNALDGLDIDSVWMSNGNGAPSDGDEIATAGTEVIEAVIMRTLTSEGAGAHLSGMERRTVSNSVRRFDCWAVLVAPTAVLVLFEGETVRFVGV